MFSDFGFYPWGASSCRRACEYTKGICLIGIAGNFVAYLLAASIFDSR